MPHWDPAIPESERAVKEAAFARLAGLYREVDAEIARLAPRCDGRGVCCDFDVVEHILFASKLEVDFLKAHDPERRHRRDSGNRCPFLEDGRCTAREHRPLGCRAYFCQPGWELVGAEIYERYCARIKAIVRERDLDWCYAPVLFQLRDEE